MKRAWLSTPLLLACACTPAGPAEPPAKAPDAVKPPASAPAPSASAVPEPPPDPSIVSVTAARAPAKLAIDGDLAEWGSLLPPPPSPDRRPPDPGETPNARPQDPDKILPSGPNPGAAESHLAFALTGEGALIAADLGAASRDGIWLGVGAHAPDVPMIGEYSRGGYTREMVCEFEQVSLGEGAYENGKPNPPEIVAACKALLARHAKAVADHKKRFTKLFKIDRDGVRAVLADGSLAAIDGSKAVWKPREQGATVEISLPLAAMPRLSEAPARWLKLVARAAAGPAVPDIAPDQWVWADLPAPVTFEPYGVLRDRGWKMVDGGAMFPTGVSYHPGDPLHVESWGYQSFNERNKVSSSDGKIYEKKATLGDIEVGTSSVLVTYLAIYRKGKLLSLVGEGPDEPSATGSEGIVTRDGELHVFDFQAQFFTEMYGDSAPKWSVIAISADGKYRSVVEQTVEMPRYEESEQFADKDLARFGVRGSTHFPADDGEPVKSLSGVEVAYQWDSAKKMYVGKRSRIPVPRLKKNKKK